MKNRMKEQESKEPTKLNYCANTISHTIELKIPIRTDFCAVPSTMVAKFVAYFEASNHEIWMRNFVISLRVFLIDSIHC
ncbi:hypothetical protein CR513_39943, partial [Mucuna pruriens]